ncbi:hypothetical protein [Microbacterium maritypicum]|uniref:hypothetical protein n=1 Tax=Microbacterium maritypicum TaxID=33918 RepID=UPI001E55EC6F|nr:hypothetical protein [Microbacterium liquefaciens]
MTTGIPLTGPLLTPMREAVEAVRGGAGSAVPSTPVAVGPAGCDAAAVGASRAEAVVVASGRLLVVSETADWAGAVSTGLAGAAVPATAAGAPIEPADAADSAATTVTAPSGASAASALRGAGIAAAGTSPVASPITEG